MAADCSLVLSAAAGRLSVRLFGLGGGLATSVEIFQSAPLRGVDRAAASRPASGCALSRERQPSADTSAQGLAGEQVQAAA